MALLSVLYIRLLVVTSFRLAPVFYPPPPPWHK